MVAGAGFGLVVEAEDQFGNPTALTGNVSLAILNNPGGSILGGTTAVTASRRPGHLQRPDAQQGRHRLHPQGDQQPALVRDDNRDQCHPGRGDPARDHARRRADPPTVYAGQLFTMMVDAEDQFGNIDTNFVGSVQITTPSMLVGTTRHGGQRRGDVLRPGDRHGRDLPDQGHRDGADLGHLLERGRSPPIRRRRSWRGSSSPRARSSTARASWPCSTWRINSATSRRATTGSVTVALDNNPGECDAGRDLGLGVQRRGDLLRAHDQRHRHRLHARWPPATA